VTLSLTHTFVSAIPDGTDATVVRPSNWNDTHTVAGTLPIANGGTNTASVPANGQLLIGDGTGYTVANLTAGTGMTITNTAGGITLSAPENGTVTGVTASSPIASSGGTAPNISLTGTVDVPHGGTGATTLTGYVIGNGASAMTASATIPISNLTGTLPVANGGTGQTTYTDGQLLIGNTTGSTLTPATLTAGTGVTITNGHGTITISAPDTGTVTSVTASSPLASSGGATPNLSLTGTVAIANGGTAGTATPTAGAVPYGTGTAYGFSAAGTTGQVLTSAGAGTPTWTTPTTGTVTSVTASSPIASSGGATPNLSLGTVPIANGGTNSTATPTAGGIGYGTGTAHAYTAAGTTGQVLTSATAGTPTWTTPTTGTVTSVAQTFTGGIISVAGSPITSSGTLALTVAGTSGGVPYFSSGSAWATSAALAANAIVLGGGAGAAPATTTTGTGVVTALGVNTGTAGAFVVNGGALGVPSSGTVTNLTGTASININGTVGATTPSTVAATTLAIGGATLGTNALAVTGTASISGGAYISNLGGANKIINGDMVIDQRGVAVTTDNTYVVDRFLVRLVNQTTQTFTAQQASLASTTPPGFINSLKYLYGGTAAAPAATMVAGIIQKVEGLNCGDMKFGTADAKAILLSFWCKSSVTGTFGVCFFNSANSRSYPATYTISVANTWEYKTVAVPGDTSGTWLVTNGIGIQVSWDLGVGATYSGSATGAWQAADYRGVTSTTKLCATTAGDFFLTGVKLEVGSIATPFVPDDYQVSLGKCLRYYQTVQTLMMNGVTTAQAIMEYFSKVPFRATPTISLYSASPYVESVPWNTVGSLTSASISAGHLTVNGGDISISGTFSPATSYGSVWILGNGGQGTTVVTFTAEL